MRSGLHRSHPAKHNLPDLLTGSGADLSCFRCPIAEHCFYQSARLSETIMPWTEG